MAKAKSGVSLSDYALTQRATAREINLWFAERPEIVKEVTAGFARYSDHTIWKWLKSEHGYPYSSEPIKRLREEAQLA